MALNLDSIDASRLLRRKRPQQAPEPAGLAIRWSIVAAPGLLVLCCIFGVPLLALIWKSFFADLGYGQIGTTPSLDNYVRFFSDAFYLQILWNTLLLGMVVVAACIVLGYPIAYLLARTRSVYRGFLIFLVVAPMLISVVIRNLGWVPLLGLNGPINWLLLWFGLVSQPVAFLNSFTGVVIGLTHSLLPYMVLTLVAVIQRIDHSIEEAAMNLGASPWQTFIRVVLPLTRPGLLGGYLLILTTTICSFTTPAILGGGRVVVMPTYIEQQIRHALQYGFGATFATILLITAMVLTIFSLRKSD